MEEPIFVNVADIRAANFCSRGARQWFTRHGLDYNEFLVRGLPIEQIEGTNDDLGRLVAEHARKRAAGEEE